MSDPRCRRDLYGMLGVEKDATGEQIRLAYERLAELTPEERGTSQSEIDHAFSVLIEPASREFYDRLSSHRPRRQQPPRRKRLNDLRILVACVVFLVAILAFVWYPLYGSRFRAFSAGDRLVDNSGTPFGVVVKVEEAHSFPGGGEAPAYLVEMFSSKELRWYPALDLKSTCRKAQ